MADLERKLDRLAEDFAEHRGEMRQFRANMENYIGAVNAKVNGHLEEHKQDLKEESKAVKKVNWERWALLVAAPTALLAIIQIWRMMP
jgi:hypothetical protein